MEENLLRYAKNVYSQAGQDGMIGQIFRTLGMRKGHFVECGAWDGIRWSNCRKLYEEGWTGVFIESHDRRFSRLAECYRAMPQITCIHQHVEASGPNRFDAVMDRHAPAMPISFLSIDVDGIDLEIFESIEKWLPLAVCLEGGKGSHPFEPRAPLDQTKNVGQSLSVIRDVARKKGYEILCAFQDVLLIKREFSEHFHAPSDLMELYVNGYLAQPLCHIPMYAKRLGNVRRQNRILDYLMNETNYRRYWTTRGWERDNRERITSLFRSLPPELSAP